jgi:hypothetical protein
MIHWTQGVNTSIIHKCIYVYLVIIKIIFEIYKEYIKVILQAYPRLIIFTKIIISELLLLPLNID